MLIQRQILFLIIDGSRSMTGDFNMIRKSTINVKKGTTARKNTHAANISPVYRTISDNNANIQTNYEKYVNDRLNHSVSSTDRKNTSQYLMDNPSSEFADKDDVTGVKVTNKDFHKVKKITYKMKLHLDSNKGFYNDRVGLNMYPLVTGTHTVVLICFFLYR